MYAVFILGSILIFFADHGVYRTITSHVIPQERAIGGMSRAVANLLCEYREYLIVPEADTLLVLDPAGTMRTVNNMACQLLGDESTECVGRHFCVVFAAAAADRFDIRFREEQTACSNRRYLCSFRFSGRC